MCKHAKEYYKEEAHQRIECLLGKILEAIEEGFEMIEEEFEEKEENMQCLKKMLKSACVDLSAIEEHLDFFSAEDEEDDEEEEEDDEQCTRRCR